MQPAHAFVMKVFEHLNQVVQCSAGIAPRKGWNEEPPVVTVLFALVSAYLLYPVLITMCLLSTPR